MPGLVEGGATPPAGYPKALQEGVRPRLQAIRGVLRRESTLVAGYPGAVSEGVRPGGAVWGSHDANHVADRRTMFPTKKSRDAAERFAERRELEDAAPRLREQIPTLENIELVIRHENNGRPRPGTTYVRHISVATGPVLFWVPCSESNCVGGGHDITRAVMRSLFAGETEFDGRNSCSGNVGNLPCQRVMLYSARARYRDGVDLD